MSFKNDYLRGLDALFDYAPHMHSIARCVGLPVANPHIPTAQVSYDPMKSDILFEINPDYISGLSDEEVGFVISHEAYHVLLSHLQESMNTTDYPRRDVLVTAHECIINDTITSTIGLDAPEGVLAGADHGADFSVFSTRDGYDFLSQNTEDEQDEQQSQSQQGSGQGGSSNGAGSGSDGSDQTEGAGGSSQQDEGADGDSGGNGGGSGDDEQEQDEQGSGSGEDQGDDTESDADDEQNKDHQHGRCGGIIIDQNTADAFQQAVQKAINDSVKDMQDNGIDVPDEIVDLMHDIDPTVGGHGFGIGNNTGSMFSNPTDDLNLDWKELLAKINPKVKSAGQKKAAKQSWHAPRRKMMGQYPKVILPVTRGGDADNGKGAEKPTLILALDMSYSIPTYLIDGLAGMADTIPDDLIAPRPVTWSDYVKEFDTKERHIVSRSGTNIDAVWDYSQKVAKETGKQPYVLVITDGGCMFYGSAVPETVQKFWYWGAIVASDKQSIKYNMGAHVDPDKVFMVNDFLDK